MGAVTTYGNIIKKCAPNHPAASRRMICVGLALNKFRIAHLGNRNTPAAYRYLNTYALGEVREALRHPEQSVWANLFAPVEILQCFDLHTLSIECLSSFLSGFTIEDYFMDYAEDEGIAPTLCSYHRNFIGAVDSGVVPPPAFAVATSTICDGNTNTFRYLAKEHDIPMYLLDIPDRYTPESESYVVGQLTELIAEMEDRFHKKLDAARLTEALERENESKESYTRTLHMMRTKAYPSTLTLQMYMLFANHVDIGTPEILKFYRQMEAEVAAAPDFDGINLFWVHLLPYYQETLKHYLDLSDDCQIQGVEMALDCQEPLDTAHPLNALAKKMILNIYNGPFERKAELVREVAETIEPDGVVNFCHWGCKQSSGGAMLLKEKMQEIDVPFLILDGDGIDRRNASDGQIRTRFEAFLEIIRQRKGGTV